LVVTEADLSEYPGWHGWLFAWTVKRADVCFVNSDATARHVERRYRVPRSKLRVLHQAVPQAAWTYSWRGPRRRSQRPVIGVLGRLEHPKKGHVVLLEALAALQARGTDAELEIVGDGPARALLEERVRTLGLSDRVRFLGTIIPPWERLASWDALVVPSLFEGFGNVVAEGLAVGTPVIVTSSGGPEDILVHGETGLLVPPGDVD